MSKNEQKANAQDQTFHDAMKKIREEEKKGVKPEKKLEKSKKEKPR